MCIISDKLKFCTCVDNNIDTDELNHYWILHRFNKDKNLDLIGEVMLSFNEFNPSYNENLKNLTKALSKDDTFDKQLVFKPKDRLEIVLNNTHEDSMKVLSFEFVFRSGKWINNKEPDPFHLDEKYDNIKMGVIKEITNN